MSGTITVVCDECGQEVEGLISAGTTPDGEAFIMTGGFHLYEFGVSCDECVHDLPDKTDTGTEHSGGEE